MEYWKILSPSEEHVPSIVFVMDALPLEDQRIIGILEKLPQSIQPNILLGEDDLFHYIKGQMDEEAKEVGRLIPIKLRGVGKERKRLRTELLNASKEAFVSPSTISGDKSLDLGELEGPLICMRQGVTFRIDKHELKVVNEVDIKSQFIVLSHRIVNMAHKEMLGDDKKKLLEEEDQQKKIWKKKAKEEVNELKDEASALKFSLKEKEESEQATKTEIKELYKYIFVEYKKGSSIKRCQQLTLGLMGTKIFMRGNDTMYAAKEVEDVAAKEDVEEGFREEATQVSPSPQVEPMVVEVENDDETNQ
ncbi:hypothetical protein V8G54_004731 [Vigna mungo]|uniref:Uncharacterized protein n=1 Tax=Vigna mungo TaxID=3915 RepID=A0AAQ3PED3_VIGMU